MLSDMSNGVGYHQCQQQPGCQCKSETIQIIIEFTFRDMPNHFEFSVVSYRFSVKKPSKKSSFSFQLSTISYPLKEGLT